MLLLCHKLSSYRMSDPASKRDSSQTPGTVYLITSDGQVLRLPIPANCSCDPLNWCPEKRTSIFLALAFFGSTAFVALQGASSMFEFLSREYTLEDTMPFNLTILSTAPTMCMGLGAFFWIPSSLALGRRPVLLIAATTLLISMIVASVAVGFHVLLAALSIVGFASGITTSMVWSKKYVPYHVAPNNCQVLLVIIEITFIHERPAAIAGTWGIIASLSFGIYTFVPMIAAAGGGWRMFYRIWIIPCVLSLFLIFFLCPETYFLRPDLALDGRILVQSATEKIYLYDEVPCPPENGIDHSLPGSSGLNFSMEDLKFWGKTVGGFKAMRDCYRQVFLCILNPLLLWVALLQAAIFGSLVSSGETYVLVLSSDFYSLSGNQIALFNLASALGAILSWPVSAYTITAVSQRLTKRNKGTCNAEYYLPAFILPALTGAGGTILYGAATELKWHWSWIYLSTVLLSISYVGFGTANTLWVTEAFPRWAGPALVVVAGESYLISFAISYTIMPWWRSQGYLKMNGMIAVIILAVGFIGVPVAFWGKKLRQHIHGKWAISEAGALRPKPTGIP
ncbi:hypothetical protein VTL71DRAFT_15620 [Oculimacula yallundae]|uniref:Uncharacterized protein n=1 Tax=Oculimacula yallundae TaxID=86028 RepID=A0ABR4CHV3_9HELO